MLTGSTVRGRKNKRLIVGQTVDTDIEEAGDNHTQQNRNDEPNDFHLALYCAYFQAYSQQEVRLYKIMSKGIGLPITIDILPPGKLYFA
jgi:hypothetical protein